MWITSIFFPQLLKGPLHACHLLRLWFIHHLDFNHDAFLYDDLKEDVSMEVIEGLLQKDRLLYSELYNKENISN